MERIKRAYADFLRAAVRSFSQRHGHVAENLLVARYFDRVITDAHAGKMDEILKQLKGK